MGTRSHVRTCAHVQEKVRQPAHTHTETDSPPSFQPHTYKHSLDARSQLRGEDGVAVTGVQAGVCSSLRLRLKFFIHGCNYLEVHLVKATSLPKMDAGLGSCDAYCIAFVGSQRFKSRLLRNSLDPVFDQVYRVAVKDPTEELELRCVSACMVTKERRG